MIQLIKFYWGLCTLKTAPQDLPASTALLGLTVLAYFVTSITVAVLQWQVPKAVLASLLDTLLLAVLSYVILWSRLLSGRYYQTLSALAGSGAILGVISLPLIVWQKLIGLPTDGTITLPSILLFLWTGWNVAVVGHILRHALSTAYALGVGLAAVYTYITVRLIQIFFHD